MDGTGVPSYLSSMKRKLIATIILIALAGLTFVQFRLLVIGAKLEKQRFDQQVLAARQNIQQELNVPNVLSDALIARLKQSPPGGKSPDFLLDSLHHFLGGEMKKQGISPNFSFAITRHFREDVLISSPNFDPEKFRFREYSVELGEYFSSRLSESFVLHIDVENLFFYLLGELDYLVIPSVLCLLAILACLVFLLHVLRKEERLNAIKNDFINNLTHELKTPAFGISLATKLARDNITKGKVEKALEYLKIIEDEKDKLVSHTEKVLELASLENGRQHFRKEKTDMHELVLEVVSGFRPKVEARGGRLSAKLEAARPVLLVDRGHFKNVLQNLLDNAMKYSPGVPQIEVATRNIGGQFELTVKDEGMGISPADQSRVFDKFYRVPSGDLHPVKGFGLGLNYVKQVVEAHGGKVEVESRLGEGTVFSVRQSGSSAVRQSGSSAVRQSDSSTVR